MAENGLQLAKAYVQIVPTTKGIKGSITEAIGGEADDAGNKAGIKITSGMKKALVAGTATLTATIGTIVKKSVDIGGDLQQSIGGIETIYKESADKMREYADNAYKTAGMSASEYMQQATSFGASLLQSLGGDTQKATEYADRAIRDMSDNANKMGTSIDLIQNAYQGFAKGNYTMLDNLKLGFGGTKEEMERLVSEASKMTAVQDELNLVVNDGDLSFGNIANAISVMQKNLGITDATVNEAATTLQGSFNAMKASAANFLGSLALGEDIKPSLNALITTTSTYLNQNLIPTLINVFKSLPSALGALSDVAYETAMNFLTSLADGFDSNVTTLIERAGPMLVTFSQGLKDKVGSFVDIGIEMLGQLAQGIADGMPSLIENVPLILSNFANIINENMPKIVKLGFDMLVTLGKGLINAIPTLIANIPQIITAILDVWTAFNWMKLGSDVIKNIKKGIESMWNSFKTYMDTNFKNLGSGIKTIVSDIKDSVVSVFNSVWSNVKTTWNNILSAIKNPIETARDVVKKAIDKMKGFFNFSWSLPKLKLPHVSISGEFSLMPPRVPKFSIDWYAKAMNKPMALDGATIFGYQNGNLLGGGEVGTEYITGEKGLAKVVSDVMDSRLTNEIRAQNDMLTIIIEILNLLLSKDTVITVDGVPLKKMVADYTIEKIGRDIEKVLKLKGV